MSSGVGFDEDYDNPLSDINMLFIRAMAMGTPVEETIEGREAVRGPGGADAVAISVAKTVAGPTGDQGNDRFG